MSCFLDEIKQVMILSWPGIFQNHFGGSVNLKLVFDSPRWVALVWTNYWNL